MTPATTEARSVPSSGAKDTTARIAPSGDLLIVGGGIYGVAMALEAARVGLKPILFERDAFGNATSRRALGILHGGLRYLQQLDLRRFRQSVRERSWFLREFSAWVQPLPCVMPLYNRGLRRRSLLRVALTANDFLSADRNRGVAKPWQLPTSRLLSARETIKWFPEVDQHGLRGAALWYDVRMQDPRGLLMALLDKARQRGAEAHEFVAAERLLVQDGRVTGLAVRDTRTGEAYTTEAPLVVNCAGPWCREIAQGFDRDVPELFEPSLAFNLLLNRSPLSSAALAVTPPQGGRTYFLLPYHKHTLAGTFHIGCDGREERVGDQHIWQMLTDLNAAVPGLQLAAGDVLRVDAGRLPARKPGAETMARHPVTINHGAQGGVGGLYSVSGVKYTTARAVAEHTLKSIYGSRLRKGYAPA